MTATTRRRMETLPDGTERKETIQEILWPAIFQLASEFQNIKAGLSNYQSKQLWTSYVPLLMGSHSGKGGHHSPPWLHSENTVLLMGVRPTIFVSFPHHDSTTLRTLFTVWLTSRLVQVGTGWHVITGGKAYRCWHALCNRDSEAVREEISQWRIGLRCHAVFRTLTRCADLFLRIFYGSRSPSSLLIQKRMMGFNS